jgi:LuxR family maltose regulon positive regulatory protein
MDASSESLGRGEAGAAAVEQIPLRSIPVSASPDPGLLLTKLMPPLVRPEAVVRERLHARLREGFGRGLTLVAAGPGFGKSTLLAAWRAQESPGRPVAWLTLTETQNDPVVLCAHVIEAVRAVRPRFGEELRAMLATAAPVLDEALRLFANGVSAGEPLSLVLDDFHRVTNPAAVRVVAWLAENSPVSLQLVVASRADPMLPLAALRAHGELVELRAAELALTEAEGEEFLNARLGLGLAGEDVTALVRRTEGWPAGLYLAALSASHAGDPRRFIQMFGASSRHVVDFFVDEVLRRQPADLQAFQIRCSILERLSGDVCDAVLQREGSRERLEWLCRSNLFVSAFSDGTEWYRFHALFADVLRNELQRREPDLVPVLHRRAAAWYREAGDVGAAIEHALAGGAFEEAADAIAENWIDLQGQGRRASIQSWLDRLPPDVRSSRGDLMTAELTIALIGSRTGAVPLVEAIVRRYPGVPHAPFAQGQIRFRSGDAGGALPWARRMVAAETPESNFWAEACAALGKCLYYNDELDESARWLGEARSAAIARRRWRTAVIAAADLSLVAAQQGDVGGQQRLAGEAFAWLGEHGLAGAPGTTGEAHTAIGAAFATEGRLEEARDALERGLELRPSTRLESLDAIVPLISVVRRLGDHARAAALLAEARAIIAECPDPGALRRRLAVVERPAGPSPARQHKRAGELTAAELRVLRLLDAGRSERQIGRELYISFNTVHTHVKSIYAKLAVGSRQQALEQARSLGFLRREPKTT